MSPVRGALPMARLEFSQALFSVRSIIFVALFLLVMAAAGVFGVTSLFLAPTEGGGGLAGTTGFLIGAMVLLVLLFGPAVAIFSAADTVVGERAARTLDALLVRPVTRRGLALGKFLGRGAHLALVATVGVLLGAAIFATRVPSLEADRVLYFTALVALLFLVYAALALLLSSVARTPGTAMALGLVVWLTFFVLWGFVQELLRLVGAGGIAPWLNPNTLFLGAVTAAFREPGLLTGLAGQLQPGQALLAMLLYLALMVALAVEVFHRQDEAAS